MLKILDQYSETLKELGVVRARLLEEKMFAALGVSRGFLENKGVVHFVLLLTTIVAICQVFARTRSISLFSMHPVMISIGVFLFLAEGMIVKQNGVLYEFFTPIMQSSQKRKLRTLHMNLQMIGSGFVAAGLVFIMIHKIEIGKSVIPQTLHSLVGTATIVTMIIQVVAGNQKMDNLQTSNAKTLRWHGDLGVLSFDLMVLSSVLGALSFLSWGSMWTFVLVALFTMSWFLVNVQRAIKVEPRVDDDEAGQGLMMDEVEEGRKL